MTTYIGSGPYCYASTVSMMMGGQWAPALIETLTGAAFGFQVVEGVPYFDPVGWDPDQGVDQALGLLGWSSERRTYSDAESAYADLVRLVARGPVFVGPIEMGLLAHQPGPDRPMGADHFLTVLAADHEGVLMHDPEGFPYAWLPAEVFVSAWGSPISYCHGRFPLRTGFHQNAAITEADAISALLPLAARWADQPANSLGLRAFGTEAAAGLEAGTNAVLTEFSLRLAARRRIDAAQALREYPRLAELLDRQARLLGRAQYVALRSRGGDLAALLNETADLHEAITRELRAAVS
ncbi:hypothetical protein [Nocardia sp. NPDC048505]|uniref:hypothetical protein n=1 Tax=unclassified Nocardia TaxID=2637762 RepID=UPI0033E55439